MINSRALVITLFVFAMFIGLIIQLFTVQIGNHDKYTAKADRQQNKVVTIKAERGIIYDRNREILAYTKDDVSLFADSRMLRKNGKNLNKIAYKLASVFNTEPSKYINMIKKAKGNICLERKIPKDKAILLDDFVVDGFYKLEDYTRVYPYSNITSHILGYVDRNCVGRAGFEKQYEQVLSGVDGQLHIERDAIGRSVSVDYENSVQAIPGNNFQLTIDKVYQKILVNELKKGVKEFEGKSGIGIIINPNTGEVLALANVPDYDPSKYSKASNFQRRNRAITDTYEPGSTMKSIVLALLLDEDIVSEKNVINTENGKYKISGALIRDTHKFKSLTVQEVLEQSSNIGIVKLSDKINPRDFYKGLRDFGFGNVTSIDLNGESRGLLKKPDAYSGISKAFISHGYEISVTPLQMIMAYAALINGGKLLKPYIRKKISNQEEVVEEFNPTKIRQVISESTSDRIRKIMVGVVENGTGSKAQQENIYVGGKTGTAQKLINGKYSAKYYNSSFIGFFPADNPKVLCLVLIDSPQKGRYGGQVAAPIFSNITKRILETDFNIERNKEKIERNNIIYDFVSEVDENELSSEEINSFANVSESNEKKQIKDKIVRTTMPNLRNKPMREAIKILSDLNIKYQIKGSGRVVEQSIKNGTPLNSVVECIIKCSNSSKTKDF